MEGVKFAERITIHCSPEEAFDYTQDYDKRLAWDTFLKKAELMHGAKAAGKGVKAYCVTKQGIGMITEYVSFNRPRAAAIKMTSSSFLFNAFAASWTFKAVGNLQTEVIFLYTFKPRFPFSLVHQLMANNLKLGVRKRLMNLKANMETGSSDRQDRKF